MSVPGVNLVVRGLSVFLFVLILLRISGKRQIGQMGATEFVAILLISNAVQNSMNAGDNSLLGGLILATTLIAASWGISFLTFHSGFMRRVFEGHPSLLIHKGSIVALNLHKERITEAELRSMLRKQGIHEIHSIHSAILEADGVLSVTRENDLKSL